MKDGNFEQRFPCSQKFFYLWYMFFYRIIAFIYTDYIYYFAPFTVSWLVLFAQYTLDAKARATEDEAAAAAAAS
jgi:hypothetical protein